MLLYICVSFGRKENVLIEISVQAANQGTCNRDASGIQKSGRCTFRLSPPSSFIRRTLSPDVSPVVRVQLYIEVLQTHLPSKLIFPQTIDMPGETLMRPPSALQQKSPSVVRLRRYSTESMYGVCPKLMACQCTSP